MIYYILNIIYLLKNPPLPLPWAAHCRWFGNRNGLERQDAGFAKLGLAVICGGKTERKRDIEAKREVNA